MNTAFRPRTLILFVGDICFFTFSLWLSLYVRAFEVPSRSIFLQHLTPFSLLFIAWVVVFFIAGLYESRSIILQRRAISATLLVAQACNMGLAALFFFFIPIFGIAPKTLLFIYLVVSFFLVLLWRVMLFPVLGVQRQERALVVGESKELDELTRALQDAPRAPTRIAAVIRPGGNISQAVREAILQYHPRFIIADFNNPAVASAFPELYNYLAEGIRFIDASTLYEEVFGRVPLSVISEAWIVRNVSSRTHTLYDFLKRTLDIVVAGVGGLLSLIFYPFIMIAIFMETGRPVFISMPRVGEAGRIVPMHKFRSMTGNDGANYGVGGATKLSVTKVGKVLRRTRLDELPQLWNVLVGELSLIGPRPESPALVDLYDKQIPYYTLRHLIKPGLSGSAQLYYHGDPHHAADVESTRMKLSYDLFYLKYRSLTLDLAIGLKTIRRLLMRSNA